MMSDNIFLINEIRGMTCDKYMLVQVATSYDTGRGN